MIITTEEVKRLGRNISAHIDKGTLEALITETEDMDIRPVLGAEFLRELSDSPKPEHNIILNGGDYDCGYLSGLKKAVAYYVQAKLIRTNDNQVSRYGLMQKDSEYGFRSSTAERNALYNDICSVADRYMQEVINYLCHHSDVYPTYSRGRVRNNRTQYRVIGE